MINDGTTAEPIDDRRRPVEPTEQHRPQALCPLAVNGLARPGGGHAGG